MIYLMQLTITQLLYLIFQIQGITNTYGASTYYAHETGTDQVNSSGTTSIDAYIQSGDFDISARKSALGQATGLLILEETANLLCL